MTRFDLVIFDCDGVVVDSERIIHAVFGEFLHSLGADLPEHEMRERFLGRTLADVVAITEALTGRAIPAGALDRYKEERDRVLREQVQPILGIREVLEGLRTPYCIASSGDHGKMRATLGATGLLPMFAGKLFSATEVARGKPAPDVFLHAAAQMGAEPERTAVIEDSVNGVVAAVAAGMTAYGFVDTFPAAELSAAGAHAVFSRMRDLPALLA